MRRIPLGGRHGLDRDGSMANSEYRAAQADEKAAQKAAQADDEADDPPNKPDKPERPDMPGKPEKPEKPEKLVGDDPEVDGQPGLPQPDLLSTASMIHPRSIRRA